MKLGDDRMDDAPATVDAGEEPIAEDAASQTGGSHGWTFVLISVGIGLIACCLLIPQADENRTLLYQCNNLKMDLEHIQKQAEVSEEFLKQINEDPAVAERLAQLQMRFVRKGTNVLDLPELDAAEGQRSPFMLVTVTPPPPLPEYRPLGGRLANLCRDARSRLYMIGGGLMLMATGLVLGYTPTSEEPEPATNRESEA
ncbi:MAG TPA: hypothetical protein VHP11_02775 [Tepidisphaeraceae bacterium]|nr:hypothetical protein [Tepidisphaeraceae bacterium]